MKLLGRIPPADRPTVGVAANRAREAIEKLVEARLASLAEVALATELARSVDVTLPGRGPRPGTLHPLTRVRMEIEQIFHAMGFEVRTGPLIETEWNNFDALNTPADHPARDMQDTFFVEGGRILRSHTSPVQVRTMLAGPPPVKIIAPGNVFRRDDDATHTPMFPQCEGLHVDKNVSFEDLKATLIVFVQRFFGPQDRHSPAPQLLPLHRAVGRGGCLVLPVPGQGAGSFDLPLVQGHRAGSKLVARAWFTPMSSRQLATTNTTSRGSPLAWDCRVWRCSSMGSRICAYSMKTIYVFFSNFQRDRDSSMKISLNWLRELVELPPGTDAERVAAP